ncbi:hypothetical protein [Parvibaculum sp.]|uniref:hypothetical protein n=1 Tax=Parvibaculum sp. TaxID=2024848 RepID=UPI002BAACA27|nr:hypothetical protein [Parvibaculum sp.]HUD51162.1 hypothetical protein [Parvibaculum sp.]
MKTYITNKVLIGLGGACLVLAGADFFREPHGHFEVERAPLFFAVFGFFIYAVLIFAARTLRLAIMRPEDFYGDRATDQEDERFAGTEAQAKAASGAGDA